MSTLDLVIYYASLLIVQYLGQPNANATIQAICSPVVMPQVSTQTITFSSSPTSGAFVLTYNLVSTAAINWHDSTATIQSKISGISGLSSVTVLGTISGLVLTVTFTDVAPPAKLLVLSSNSLVNGSTDVGAVILETDITLPLAVQGAYNMVGDDIAAGVQLDVLGKYAGVTRSGFGANGVPITLDDSDYFRLIQLAVIQNSAGSSLYDIQQLLVTYFPGEILVFDYADMRLSYFVSSSIGSQSLLELFISEGLLPKPMGVQIASIVTAPIIDAFFGFRTYELPGVNNSPLNSYTDYESGRPWLSYADILII